VPEELHIVVNGKELKQVNKFCYLGITYDSSAVKELTINESIDQYSRNVGMLYPLLKDQYVPSHYLQQYTMTITNIRMCNLDIDNSYEKQSAGGRNESTTTNERYQP